MKVHIQWEPDPEEMGYNPDGTPKAREALITEDVLVVWIDQFGTPQYCAQGIFENPEVDAIVETLPTR